MRTLKLALTQGKTLEHELGLANVCKEMCPHLNGVLEPGDPY
jgi:hypothetical protein